MSRARSIWLVARRELFERGRSRGFIFSVLFTTTIIIGSFVVPALIIGDEGPTQVGVVEPAPEGLAAAISKSIDDASSSQVLLSQRLGSNGQARRRAWVA